jgi:2,3,4,5-tetrahydropyridine-2-carboxylate N-succinyltransferase
MTLQRTIEKLYTTPPEKLDRDEARKIIARFKEQLNSGEVRSAERVRGTWKVNEWVKKGIILAFRLGNIGGQRTGSQFFDKDTMGLKYFSVENGIRIVPGGTAVRDGCFIGKGVVMMPPSYVNIGAYVDEQTMIDSHALVGSCAQIGKHVHLSAGAQIGGVLEPIGSMPVIIEDEVMVGGNTGIYEGAIVKRRAVIGAGVVLTGSTPVYDLVKKKIYRRTTKQPLMIPSGAVVIPGSRKIEQPFAKKHELSVSTPIIIKYRDEKTDAAVVLEASLRAYEK